MGTKFSSTTSALFLIAILTLLPVHDSSAQVVDSSAHSALSSGAIQFQLLGGIGIAYIGGWGAPSQYRIAADVSLNHANQDGTNKSYSGMIPSSGQSSSSIADGPSEQTTNSYQIALSALYLQQLGQYPYATIYCGVGPMVNHSWSRSRGKNSNVNLGGSYYSTSYMYNSESTTRFSGIGPVALAGVSGRVIDHVSLSAEIGFGATYQWGTQTNSYTSAQSYQSQMTETYYNGGITSTDGWVFSINVIRIGVIIGL